MTNRNLLSKNIDRKKVLKMLHEGKEEMDKSTAKIPFRSVFVLKRDKELINQIEHSIRKAIKGMQELRGRLIHSPLLQKDQKTDYEKLVAKTKRELRKAGHKDVYDTNQLKKKFIVEGFSAPFVVVRRKTDNKRGSLMFISHPRVYYGFVAD